ncbi:MAG: formylglycine-generating enzyme family protein [Nitrospira sp.]|nr:formylglycine-generating enzyme family protein [Nitrospira sp.]MCP9443477.1 formylglycine-generating enzyme family protein [Nitrospira sp.]
MGTQSTKAALRHDGLTVIKKSRGLLVGPLGRSRLRWGNRESALTDFLATALIVLAICHVPAVGASSLPDETVLIPAGEFFMGSPDDGSSFDDERPQRKVFVGSFRIHRHEVTNARYKRFVDATGHRTPSHENPRLTLWLNGEPFPGSEQHPVVNVSWDDALAYCRWLGMRLPTEAEWEKAARGTDGRRYPWGNEWNGHLANSASHWADRTIEFKDGGEWKAFWITGDGARIAREHGLNGEVLTLPVGSFPGGSSPYGLLDMAGNVSEWVQDWYEPYSYLHAPLSDPQGPDGRLLKVVRGGSWLKPARNLRTSDRDYSSPADRATGIGFRCAQDAW